MLTYSSRYTLLLLLFLLLLASALRLYRVGSYGIYFDEKSTLLISQGVVLEGFNQKDVFSKKYFTPAEFWKPKTFHDFMEANIRGDIGNSPVYYGVLWGWTTLAGLSDTAIRLPSVVFSVLLVGLLFGFVRRHFGFLGNKQADALALTAAAIATVEPFFVAYSHIARNYSMTFFLTLLATHVFLLLLNRVNLPASSDPTIVPTTFVNDRGWALYVAYGLVFVLSVLSHYLSITVFLCHALYALLYVRRARVWLGLGAVAVAGLALVSLWFVFGGGRYTFFTLNYQAGFYRNIALTNPTGSPFGLVLPATLPNIAKLAVPIFSDLFIVTNGLGSALLGIRNSALALGLGAGAVAVLYRYQAVARPPIWVYAALPLLFLAGLPLYTVVPLRFLVLSAAVPFVYLIGRYVVAFSSGEPKKLVVLLLLLSVVPTFFLLLMAWRSGHTFGITQRYSGFSFPYVCILVAMGIQQLWRLRWWFSVPLAAGLLIQGAHIIDVLADIYADHAPKYTYFDKARVPNPYWSSARQLIKLYEPGDTILYPNKKRIIYSEKMDRTYSPVSLLDAQLINIYLPRQARYIQRIDPNEPDRIVLRKGHSGRKITIFDLKGSTFRYGD